MREAKRSLIGGILLLAVLTALFGAFLLPYNASTVLRRRMEARVSELQAIDEALTGDLRLYLTVSGSVIRRGMAKTLLTASACRKVLAESGEQKPTLFMDGAVVRVTEQGLETPEGFPAEVTPESAQLQGEVGITYLYGSDALPLYAIFYSRVDGDSYYLRWESYDELDARAKELFDFEKSFAGMEDAFHTGFLLILPASGEEGRSLFYKSEAFAAYDTAEALGITDEMLAAAIKAGDALTAEGLRDACKYLDIDGQRYELLLRELGGEVMPGAVVAYLTPSRDAAQQVREETLLVLAVFAGIGVILLVWFFSVISLVRGHALNEQQREQYGIMRYRRRLFGILGVSAALILAFSALTLSLFRLFEIHSQVDTALTALQRRIEENGEQSKITAKVNKEMYGEYASLTAGIMSEYPELFGAEELQTVCDTIEADYLMLFDENGDELLSNSDFVGLRLGTDASSSTYEFRLLLNGVPLITHEAAADEQTRLKNVMIGARVGSAEAGYRALLLAVPEKKIYSGSAESVESILKSLAAEGMLAFSMEPDSGLIRAASDGALTGLDASALGLPESARKPGFQDFFTLSGVSYYGKNADIGGTLYFFAARSEHIYSRIPLDSLLTALVSLALWSLLALYLMRVYRKTYERFASEGAPLDAVVNDIRLSDGTLRQSTDPSQRWRMPELKNDERMPRRNAALAAKILFLLCIVLVGVNLYAGGRRAPLVSFIVQGQWTKGFNLFAVTSVFLLLAETLVIVAAVKLLIRLVSRALGTRGETVCRLLLNLVGYAGGIFFVYNALYALGFAPGTLLASLGLLSFAVSLGAKDLVTDIVAGLSIVFEGTYQVGDIIEIANYRGEVLEIGVRTTKLEGRGGNIKIIANRDVKNVVNMTRKSSWYPLEVTVSADQSLEKIEALLAAQLPHIGAAIPEIVSGPYYKGVTALVKGNMTLSIIAECNEADYHSVQRALNGAVQELFAENQIRIM